MRFPRASDSELLDVIDRYVSPATNGTGRYLTSSTPTSAVTPRWNDAQCPPVPPRRFIAELCVPADPSR
ncbi:hypothetical protein ACQPZG_00505 (plasmid) [Streptomyces sp. CA-294286]|uniref:hypothetical protein n=1 Tax=Streptomyces sp. CA-294286 TaxID=3240070 RepID=UPI003D8C849B